MILGAFTLYKQGSRYRQERTIKNVLRNELDGYVQWREAGNDIQCLLELVKRSFHLFSGSYGTHLGKHVLIGTYYQSVVHVTEVNIMCNRSEQGCEHVHERGKKKCAR